MASARTPNILKLLIGLLIDFFRWTQLTPMITLWFFATVMLVAMAVVNNQDQLLEPIFLAGSWVAGLPVVGEALLAWAEGLPEDPETGGLHLGGDEIRRAGLAVWGVLSLAMAVMTLLANALFGPFPPWPFKRKLIVLTVACCTLFAGLAVVYLLDSSQFNGPAWHWMAMFTAVCVLLFLISAWCLAIAHALGMLGRLVQNSNFGTQRQPAGNL